MTAEERRALEQEETRRLAYGNGMLHVGPSQHMHRLKGGWQLTAWDGSIVPGLVPRKRDAEQYLRAAGLECLRKAREIAARLEAARFDELLASTTPGEREATARAMHDAYAPTGHRRRSA